MNRFPFLKSLSIITIIVLTSTTIGAQDRLTPIIEPDAARLSFDELGLYAVGYQYRGQNEKQFPIGWSNDFEARTGVALKPAGTQNGRAAWLEHPPWRGGTGITFQEFRLQLPPADKVQRIMLRGATAMRADALAKADEKTKSDGVTFRIKANGRALLDEHRDDAQWKDFALDLSALAGQVLTLRFETDPGPHDNSSFDFALWSGRVLELQGFKAPPIPAVSALPPLDLRRLYPFQNGEVAPPSAFDENITTKVENNVAILNTSGADGNLQYQWTRPRSANDAPLGNWQLSAKMRGAKTTQIMPLAGDASIQWTQNATFQSSRLEATPNGATCISTYDLNGKTATLRCAAKLVGKSLVLEISCDTPNISALNIGRWGPVLHRRAVTVPYYSGQIYFLEHENLFANAFLDWTASMASSHDGNVANYNARTDGTRVLLHERAIFTAAWQLAETLPNVPNPPSPFRAHLADKIVLDVWGGQFNDIARRLQLLHDYGITNCAVIIHDWQRDGYDNGLPAHVPANAKLGGDAAMKNLTATAKKLGYDIALHENYVDYYPNYEHFDESDIALNSEGKRVEAWYNPGTKIQSFAVQPHAILKLAREQSAQIRALYAPNADYLDVHSAVPPWFHVDFRAASAGSATYQPTWTAHRELWAYERALYGGPVLGEGNNHWYWSGLLDGVEAQFGSGWPSNEGQSAPLAIDFTLLKVHPLQFNHGMGYYERWWNQPTWNGLPPMQVLDQYRMQEIIYGHAGFLGSAIYDNVPLAWLEHHLLTPVTALTATARPQNIEYQVNEKWVDGSAAAKAQNWQRVRVKYDKGVTITANNSAQPLQSGNFVLPQFGWLAQGAGVEAWTALRDGVIADYARTPTSTFANARRASDWNQSGIHRLRPSVAGFEASGERSFALTYQWQVGENLPENIGNIFVHFVDKSGDKIVLQNDHELPLPAADWKIGDTVKDGPYPIKLPDNLPDGDYGVRIGLTERNGNRLSLLGASDGSSRIRLGTLGVRAEGKQISFAPETVAPESKNDIYQQRLNASGKVLDFGDVRTNGSVLVRREGDEWVLRALPRDKDFSLQLSAKRFGRPANVRCGDGAAATIAPQNIGDWWALKLNGAREYHWK